MDRTDRAFEQKSATCTGPHTCPGQDTPVRWCRQSCTLCTNGNPTPCFGPHPAPRQPRQRELARAAAAELAGALGVAAVLLIFAGLLGGFAYVARLGWELAG